MRELGATGDPLSRRPLAALAEGDLYFRKSDSAVFIGTEAGADVKLARPADRREPAGEAAKAEITKVKVNNGLRRVIRDVLGTLTLGSDDPAVRLAAAETMFRRPTRPPSTALDAAIAEETDAERQGALEQARAVGRARVRPARGRQARRDRR